MKRLNILEVVEACGAGVGRHVSGLCTKLVAQGHRVTVAYAPHRVDDSFRRFMIDQRSEICFVPLKAKREVSLISDSQSILKLIRLIRSEGAFDVIHGHSSKGGAIARIAGRLLGLPTVYTPHTTILTSSQISRTEAAVYTWIERFLGHWATSKVIAVSEGERQFILKLGLTPDERTVLINNGIDDRIFEHFGEIEVPSEGVDDKHPITFGALMRFSPEKGPGDLVEAFSRLDAELPEIPMRLVIAGDGELFQKVKTQVDASDAREKVALPGWKPNVSEVLRGCDVYVLSSRYEGGSYALIEAMAAKLPIVSTNVFGTEETIGLIPGNVLVPAMDSKALAAGMKQMITLAKPGSLRQTLRKIGQANHDYALAHFTESQTVQHTLEVYQALRPGH